MTVQDTDSQSVQKQIDYEELEAAYVAARESGEPEYDNSVDVMVSIPTDTAVALKHATGGRLDIAAAASLVLQLYSTAPLDRSAKTLTSAQHAQICEALGVSPQTTDELVGAIVELTRISFGGLRVKFTAEQVATINGRNVMGLPAKQYAQELIESWYEAWRNGVIG